MHALAVLMHEAAHFNLFSSRKWNDRIAKMFITGPAFISLENYRTSHIKHHQFNLTSEDPTFVRKQGQEIFTFPQENSRVLLTHLLKILFGFGLVLVWRDLKRNRSTFSSKRGRYSMVSILFRLLPMIGLLAVLISLGWFVLFLKFWLVPLLTVVPAINYWRSAAEHYSLPKSHSGMEKTRTTLYHPLIAFFIAPYHVNYHLEHHLNAKRPWFELKVISQQHRPFFSDRGHYTMGLRGLWNELVLRS